MSLITDTWRQLVRRRLWPVAVLLLVALVAVPLMLAKSPATPPAAAAPAPADESKAPAGGGLTAQPVVAVADASPGSRSLLGARKNPFAPAPQRIHHTQLPPVSTPPPLPSPTAAPTVQPFPTLTPPSTTAPYPNTTNPSNPSNPKPKPAPGTLTVRFGDATNGTLTSMHVKKLDALPDPDQPVAIYVGTTRHGRVAKFIVDSTVTPEGDGRCLPDPTDCATVELRAGDTEFFTVAADSSSSTTTTTTDGSSGAGTQYELDLVRIAKAKSSSKGGSARASRAHTAHVGGVVARVVRVLRP